MRVFENILVPVDFSINTEVAINKAMALATPGLSQVLLLHVLSNGILVNMASGTVRGASTENVQAAKAKLLQWKQRLGKEYPSIRTDVFVSTAASVEAGIISAAQDLDASLVIIGKNNHHSFLPFLNTVTSASLAEATGAAVLTVKPGSMNKATGTVVMPVADFYPKRKIDLLAALSSRLPLNVHLLTILNNRQHPDDHSASALLQSMRSIRSRLQCNVQHCVVHADNKAIATLRYASQVNADMVLVHPETEAVIQGWMQRKDITDVLKPASALQVLSVQAH